MVNCNPETVSTDYDTSDRLYFEPLTAEDVLELIAVERSNGEFLGVIVQFGGQTPLKLAQPLEEAGVPILGTSPDAIDLAEDRERFQLLLHRLGIAQPVNGIARSAEEAFEAARRVGLPVVIRPSYVLGGRAMEIIRDEEGLERYIKTAVEVSGASPVLIDQYLSRATEVDVDALCDGESVFVAGVMEHIEEAGRALLGDSACSLPPYSLTEATIAELKRQTEAMAFALNVRGLMNVQFAIEETLSAEPRIFVLEVNPRASRTVPFVAKAVGRPIAAIAAKLMAGARLADFGLIERSFDHIAVKEAVFPFARFPGVDTVLGPEMRSTGEVMGLDWRRPGEDPGAAFARAFAKSQLGGGVMLPSEGCAFISVKAADKPFIVEPARRLLEAGFSVIATGGTCAHLREQGLEVALIKKVLEGAAEHRGRHEERRGADRLQHHRGPPVAGGLLLAQAHGADDEDSLLHDHRRRARRGAGHHGPRRARSAPAAELSAGLALSLQAAAPNVSAPGLLVRRPLGYPRRISDERRLFGQHLVVEAPADRPAERHIERGEALPEQVRLVAEREEQALDHVVIGAPAERVGGDLELGVTQGHRRLDDRGREHHPAQVGAAPGVLGARRERPVAIAIRQVEADRCRLRDHRAVHRDGGHLAHGVDRQVSGLLLIALADVDRLDTIGRSQLLQHPKRRERAAERREIEDDVVRHVRVLQ